MKDAEAGEIRLITDTAALEEACERLSGDDFLAVDTEFHRETTYWPQVCLIQVASSDYDVLVDPLAKGIDLAPLNKLLADPSRTKVFHAARQDLEIFSRLIGHVPGPVFDTQIAAMAAGLGDSISYENLVARVVRGTVDKSSQFTDWVRRPLTREAAALCARRRGLSARDLQDPAREAGEAEPHGMDRGRARGAARSGDLRSSIRRRRGSG